MTPLVRLFSCLVPKSSLKIGVDVDGREVSLPAPTLAAASSEPEPLPIPAASPASGATRMVSLLALARGRSGDKGDAANIGVLARKPEFVPLLRAQLTSVAVKNYFAHFVNGEVERFEWPGLHGFNFLLHEALGGGGMASLRYDPQGKMLAQVLMDFPIQVPTDFQAA